MPSATSTATDPPRGPGRFADGVAGLAPADWNAGNRSGNPFVDHRFLAALEDTGCVGPGTGWRPRPLVSDPASHPGSHPGSQPGSHQDGRLTALPVYLKSHSHGEFVFDWAWARAAHQAGLAWYPKLLVAAPFTPVTGPRLLGANPDRALELVDQLRAETDALGLSSAGINFCDPSDAQVLERSDWLARGDWQYHWFNPGYRDFQDFLSSLRRKARKNIQRERRLAAGAGWEFEWVDGTRMNTDHLELIHACYRMTFLVYGNHPALGPAFFAESARRFGPNFLACIARREGRALACAVFWRDAERLYGRYWGSLEETRDVHFEACYYQGIEYCIRERLKVFEPGAQGEHKIRRGFLPVATRSYHYIRHPGLRAGIADWLGMEREALDAYRRRLEGMNPFGEADPRPEWTR